MSQHIYNHQCHISVRSIHETGHEPKYKYYIGISNILLDGTCTVYFGDRVYIDEYKKLLPAFKRSYEKHAD